MTQVDQLLSEALKLDVTQRSELVARLLESVADLSEEIDHAWREEVRERMARMRSGQATLIPWEETERRLLAK